MEQEQKPDDAALLRERLIFGFPDSVYWDQALEQHLEAIADQPQKTIRFVDRLASTVDESQRRDLQATKVEALYADNQSGAAFALAIRLLKERITDDAAERAFTVVDDQENISRLTGDELLLLGRTAHAHRHFERAIELLERARERLRGHDEEIDFLIGRAYFWSHDWDQAEKVYLAAASRTRSRERKASLLFHAARSAQLRGDDAHAEKLMTRAIAVPGRFSATAAALTQRMRTRLRDHRNAEALHDLKLMFRLFPRSAAVVDAGIAYVVGMVGEEKYDEALRIIPQIPDSSTDALDRAEIAYWKGRALEKEDPLSALDSYLDVLTTDRDTLYPQFVRERLKQPAMQKQVEAAVARRRPEIEEALNHDELDKARALQTEILLMTGGDVSELQRLRGIYLQIDRFGRFVSLEPEPFPAFPLGQTGGNSPEGRGGPAEGTSDAAEEPIERPRLLMAMGLFDEAIPDISDLYPSGDPAAQLTESLALREGGALRDSIRTAEILERSLPDQFVERLLPREAQMLLYPRYFYATIQEQSEAHDADPLLVLSIMREESRFNPHAKSAAAARGLLQFVITTARDIALELGLDSLSSEQLYEPDVVIRLGAKYIGKLRTEFHNDPFKVAAAYNAGAPQAELWSRLAPGEGDDFFYASVNFSETKNYVRKVLHSYEQYAEIYGD